MYSVFLTAAAQVYFQLAMHHALSAFMTIFTLMPYVSYATVIFAETGADLFKSLKPLLLSMLTDEHEVLVLRKMRLQLRREIRHLVDRLGPMVFDNFDDTRRIQTQDTPPLRHEPGAPPHRTKWEWINGQTPEGVDERPMSSASASDYSSADNDYDDDLDGSTAGDDTLGRHWKQLEALDTDDIFLHNDIIG
jgi:hypothetical protein